MTREDAVNLLDNLLGMIDDNRGSDYDKALKMAISALCKDVPDTNVGKIDKDTNVPNNDIISRQGAIDGVKKIPDLTVYSYCSFLDMIMKLPSAQRKGKWIYLTGLDVFECSVCGGQMVRNIFDYCPWCGASMREGSEDE